MHDWMRDLNEPVYLVPSLLQYFPTCIFFVVVIFHQARRELEHELINRGSEISNEYDLRAFALILVFDDWYDFDSIYSWPFVLGGGAIDSLIIGDLTIPDAVGGVLETDPLALECWLLFEDFAFFGWVSWVHANKCAIIIGCYII